MPSTATFPVVKLRETRLGESPGLSDNGHRGDTWKQSSPAATAATLQLLPRGEGYSMNGQTTGSL